VSNQSIRYESFFAKVGPGEEEGAWKIIDPNKRLKAPGGGLFNMAGLTVVYPGL